MMKTVGVFEAKTHLSELIESGESVTITKHGKPVATLQPIRRDPNDAVARIRALRGSITASSSEIVQMIREGRR
jgi:prevent-host-death family protein